MRFKINAMWSRLGQWVLKNRAILLIALLIITVFMGYHAAQVKLSYEFSKAIPSDNPKYQAYQNFKSTFGDDGNLLLIGVQTGEFFHQEKFEAYKKLSDDMTKVDGILNVMAIPGAYDLLRDDSTGRLNAVRVFEGATTQEQLDSAANRFAQLPFYIGRLYQPENKVYMMMLSIDPKVLANKSRSVVIQKILDRTKAYEQETGIKVHLSGLPLIRTVTADRIQAEMKYFLALSLLLSALILWLFFRSLATMLLSLTVVAIGVIWTVALIPLFGFKITLLTALIPSLVVIIGIPNAIYFLNKYHTAYKNGLNQHDALVEMVKKMGIVTLFCNIVAAIGFAVFALTESALLKEFGMVAGLGIMFLFVISFVLLPTVLSYRKAPSSKELAYLEMKSIDKVLTKFQDWVSNKRKWVVGFTVLMLVFSILGMLRLKSVGYIVDDLPKKDVIYQDLKFFEKAFKGIMPLEIMVDAGNKNSFTGLRALKHFEKVEQLNAYLCNMPNVGKPLALTEGLKFAKQAYYEGDSAQYLLPNSFDGAFVGPYLRPAKGEQSSGMVQQMTKSFLDSARQITRISVQMADVGTEELPKMLSEIESKTNELFDSSQYKITLTGTGVTFQEGSRFIINGLKESIAWAFALIALCMLYLFKSLRMLWCSFVPNVIPLLFTAGVMGWAGVPLKPSTVLVFCVALGIAVDITIRFLVNYKQELPEHNGDVATTTLSTLRNTGLSIIYTTLVLVAGFILFCFSSFGGTFALGWLTSLTLVTATVTNLVLLPVLLTVGAFKK